MTWAEYLVWWQDPLNLWHTFVCACLYAFGRWIGYRRGWRDARADLVAKAQLFALTQRWLNKHNAESEK